MHFGNIPPARLSSQFRHTDFFRELRPQSRQIFFLFFQFLLIRLCCCLRVGNLIGRSRQRIVRLADQTGNPALLRHYLDLIIIQLCLIALQLCFRRIQFRRNFFNLRLRFLILLKRFLLIGRQLFNIIRFIQRFRKTARRKEHFQIQIIAFLIHKLNLQLHALILFIFQGNRFFKFLICYLNHLVGFFDFRLFCRNFTFQFIQIIAHLRQFRI